MLDTNIYTTNEFRFTRLKSFTIDQCDKMCQLFFSHSDWNSRDCTGLRNANCEIMKVHRRVAN